MKAEIILDFIKSNPYSAFFYTPAYYKNAYSYFFKVPDIILYSSSLKELEEQLDLTEEYKNKGFTGYGYIKYEAGYLFEENRRAKSDRSPRTRGKAKKPAEPLAKFCLFDEKNTMKIKSTKIDFGNNEDKDRNLLPTPYSLLLTQPTNKNYTIENFRLNTDKLSFLKNIERIKKYISQGDTYQVNYTVKSRFDFKGDISSLFCELLFSQSARYSAFINDEKQYVLSLSPELFFEHSKGKIICKPMKGTGSRGYNTDNDNEKKQQLEESEKNRAENVMIVDLERNDLSRIADDCRIKVKKLFETEKYETLYQLTSTIEASYGRDADRNLRPTLSEIIKKLFPCGSITGAPKIRTMEIITEIEKEPRGLYTGALGIVSRGKDIFSIPIRTISINTKTGKGEMGIGSGIVWDSLPEEEYKETLLKSNFLTNPVESFYLFETMLIENKSVFLFDEHLNRLRKAADFFLFNFNERKIKNAVLKILKQIQDKRYKIQEKKQYRLRLMLDKWGKVGLEINELNETYNNVKIAISDYKVDSKSKFRYFKTSDRELYDREYKKYREAGFFDVVFFNEKDELAEGSITNIFIRKNNSWFTPKLCCGLLNGIYRDYFISKHPDCIESILYKDDLLNADEIILTNSVKKEIRVISLVH